MRSLRFNLKTLLVLLLIVALIAAIIGEIRKNRSLEEENRLLRRDLGIPANLTRGKVYVSRAANAPVTTPFHWAWRIFLPEGYHFRIMTKTEKVPMSQATPTEGDVAFELPPGEVVLRLAATWPETRCNVELSAELVTGANAGRTYSIAMACDGAALRGGSVSYEPMTEGARPTEPTLIFKAYSTESAMENPHIAESGLMIWLEASGARNQANAER